MILEVKMVDFDVRQRSIVIGIALEFVKEILLCINRTLYS